MRQEILGIILLHSKHRRKTGGTAGSGVAARQAKDQRGRTGRQFIYSLCVQTKEAVYEQTETVYIRCLSNLESLKDVHKLTN